MNQTTLEEFRTPEKYVYGLIEETIIDVIHKYFLHEKELKLQKCQGYWSITYLSSIIAKIHFGKKVRYIAVDSHAAKPLLDKKNIQYSSTKSDPQFVRIFLGNPDDVRDYLDIISVSVQSTLNNVPRAFDCCSRYEVCSNAKKCLQPDEQLRLDCGYRRALAAGRIFYGKNKNT